MLLKKILILYKLFKLSMVGEFHLFERNYQVGVILNICILKTVLFALSTTWPFLVKVNLHPNFFGMYFTEVSNMLGTLQVCSHLIIFIEGVAVEIL